MGRAGQGRARVCILVHPVYFVKSSCGGLLLLLGRDGLTHNMLDNIHAHWKRRRVCKIKCKGVCTVDMDNVRHQLEVLFHYSTSQTLFTLPLLNCSSPLEYVCDCQLSRLIVYNINININI